MFPPMRRHGLGLLLLAQASSGLRQAPGAILRQQPTSISSPLMYARQPPPLKDGDWVSRFCVATNSLFAQTVFPPIRKAISLRDAGSEQPVRSQQSDTAEQTPFNLALTKLTSPPEMPGLSRPVWLVIAASLPTALGWYGYYKFSVEEELYWDELQREGRATGCGGYGTLLPFVWAVLLGGLGGLLEVPGSETVVEAGAAWILLGQINLYRRVNELVASRGGEEPLHPWWALLPPPLDVVVGLRQVHSLARYWSEVRGEAWEGDEVAEVYFPFISSPRFTLLQFARTPSNWFWFTTEWRDIEWIPKTFGGEVTAEEQVPPK